MEKEFLPYQIAVDMKLIGFDEPCLKVGNPNGHIMWKWIEVDGEPPTVNINDVIQVHYDENWIEIPTFSQAFRWFREKCCIQNEVCFDDEGGIHYYYVIRYFKNKKWNFYQNSSTLTFKTYEDAELECLKKLIELVKEK